MKNNLLKLLGCAAVVSMSFSSCIKDDDVELTNQGTTFLKVLEAPENKMFFGPFSDIKTIDLFSVRRDAATSEDVQKSSVVKLTLDTAYLATYNDDNGTDFQLLPTSLYTTDIAHTGLVYEMPIGPGETGKAFTIKLNGAKWDPSVVYAMPFYISDSAGIKLSDGKDHIIALLSIINQWDGKYELTGSLVDVANATLLQPSPTPYYMVTAGTTTVQGWEPLYVGGPGVPLWSGITSGKPNSYYGSFFPVFEFDPATNKIISVKNSPNEVAGNTRSAQLDPSGENMYYSDTKTIKVKFFMKQPSVVPAAPNIRVTFDWTLKYTGPR